MIYQAITTRYAGPTNTKGGRIIATTASGLKAEIIYPRELDSEAAHRLAAETLCAKLGWGHHRLVSGGTKQGYAFVMLDQEAAQ